MPRSGWPSASSAPTNTTPCPWLISRTSARPIRPEAPATTIFTSAMGSDFRIHRGRGGIAAPRHRHHGGAQQPVADHETGLHHVHNIARRLAVARHFRNRLMQIGIELAFGADLLDAII